jgi:endonuclease/exonuclease/phosphatase family metal-dependent hydrolase
VRPANAGPALTVITHNIGDAGKVAVPLDVLLAVYEPFERSGQWPDVFVVQEVRAQGELLRLSREISQRSGRDYDYALSEQIGVGVIARGTLSAPRTLIAAASKVDYGAFGVTVGGSFGEVDVVGVHLDAVVKARDRSGFTAAWGLVVQLIRELTMPTVRSRMAREIHSWIRTWSTHPVVMGGDFNTVPQSTAIRFVRRRYADALRGTDHHATGTYWKIHGPQPRVDFIFHSRRLARLDARVIERRAGDHYPVWARLTPRARR